MRNRLTRRQQQIAVCAFGCLLAIMVSPAAQAAGMAYSVTAEGSWISVSGDLTWTAGTSDLSKIPPLNCGGEVLQGGHAVRVLSWGGTYQSQGVLDATDTLIFQQGTQATNLNGVYRDGLFVDGCGAPWDESVCGALPDGTPAGSAYCSGASITSSAVGKQLNIQSEGGTLQGDFEVPDSLAARILISGDGIGTIKMESFNLAGLGNTTGLGYENSMSQRIMSSGSPFRTGANFQWESFAGLWQEPPAETPEETG